MYFKLNKFHYSQWWERVLCIILIILTFIAFLNQILNIFLVKFLYKNQCFPERGQIPFLYNFKLHWDSPFLQSRRSRFVQPFVFSMAQVARMMVTSFFSSASSLIPVAFLWTSAVESFNPTRPPIRLSSSFQSTQKYLWWWCLCVHEGVGMPYKHPFPLTFQP